MAIKISANFSDAIRTMDAAPDKVMEAVKRSARKAAGKASRQIKSGIDPRFKKLVTYRLAKGTNRNLSLAVGLFKGKGHVSGTQPKRGSTVDDWFKFYWRDYGTLEERDRSHHFKNGRKSRSRNWKGGILPRKSFDMIEDRALQTFEREFENNYNSEIKKAFK